MDYKTFLNNFPKIIDNVVSIGKRNPSARDQVKKVFNKEAWISLSNDKKAKHSLIDCKGCLHDPDLKDALADFPIGQKMLKFKAKEKQAYVKRKFYLTLQIMLSKD